MTLNLLVWMTCYVVMQSVKKGNVLLKKGVRVREGENSLQLCLVISIWDFFDSFFKNLSIGDFIETKYLPKVAKLKWQNQDSNSGPCNYKANDLSLHQRE